MRDPMGIQDAWTPLFEVVRSGEMVWAQDRDGRVLGTRRIEPGGDRQAALQQAVTGLVGEVTQAGRVPV